MMIKTVVDLRGSFGPARDQDPRPTCLAFAASDAHAAARALPWQDLSTEWAYYHAIQRGGTHPDDGTTLEAMLDAIKLDGQPPEGVWPYIQTHVTDLSKWKPPAPCPTIFFRDNGGCGATPAEIISQLDAGNPVLTIMTTSNAFYRPDKDGVVDSLEPTVPDRLHAVISAGYGEANARQFILVRNSWGEGWGLQGYAWLSTNYLIPRLVGAAIMTTEL